MTSTLELERASLAELAVLCQRVADYPGAYLAVSGEEASKLKLEWETLQSPPSLNLSVQRRIEQQKDHLGTRMVKSLAAFFRPSPFYQRLFPRTPHSTR